MGKQIISGKINERIHMNEHEISKLVLILKSLREKRSNLSFETSMSLNIIVLNEINHLNSHFSLNN